VNFCGVALFILGFNVFFLLSAITAALSQMSTLREVRLGRSGVYGNLYFAVFTTRRSGAGPTLAVEGGPSPNGPLSQGSTNTGLAAGRFRLMGAQPKGQGSLGWRGR